jgi:hypothetical protein
MKKVAPKSPAKKSKPMPKNKLRPVARAKAKPSPAKHRPAVAAGASRIAKVKVKPAAKTVAAPKPVAKTVILTKPIPLPKPSLSVKPIPKNTPVIIPPRPNANGLHPRPGVPSKPMLPIVKPLTKPPMVAAIAVPVTTPVKPESTIPPDKDLSIKGEKAGQHVKDRIVLMVPDPFWLHTYWEISHHSVQRAEAALGQDWHGAKPILRLFDVTSQDTTSTSETPVRDILLHGGCNHWYVDVPQPPRSYRVDIGYISRRGQFYVLARSNVVTPPKAGVSEPLTEGWSAEVESKGPEKILAMSTGYESAGGPSQLKDLMDEQFRRPLKDNAFGSGATLPTKLKKFHFELDAELIVYGKTDAAASVTLQNEPVKLRPDGTFTMRFSLPDSRQIIPAVATAQDGMEERTIVLAVERNTKHLDPMVHDAYGEQ